MFQYKKLPTHNMTAKFTLLIILQVLHCYPAPAIQMLKQSNKELTYHKAHMLILLLRTFLLQSAHQAYLISLQLAHALYLVLILIACKREAIFRGLSCLCLVGVTYVGQFRW